MTSSGWTRQRRCEYRQTTVQEPWGATKAITATACKLAILVYRMLRDRLPYRERTAADYDQQQRSRILRGLRRRAASLGCEIVDAKTGVVM